MRRRRIASRTRKVKIIAPRAMPTFAARGSLLDLEEVGEGEAA